MCPRGRARTALTGRGDRLGSRPMARITIEDCMKAEGNRFSLVLMAAIRTKQIMRGARPLLRAEENKPVVVSLREIAAGHVRAELRAPLDDPPEDAAAK